MNTTRAKDLLFEAQELHEQGSRQGNRAAMKDRITERVTEAVRLAPDDVDILFMATLMLRPYGAAFTDVKRLVSNYQECLDRLGGPSDEILEIAGVERSAYERHRASIK